MIGEMDMNAQRKMSRPTLVLNKHWSPIQTAPVQEALSLVAKGSAKIIDPKTFEAHDLLSWNDVSKAKGQFEDSVIRSARLSLVAPEVIVLTGYEGLAVRSVVFSRKSLFKRDRYTCQYCGKQPGPSELTIDHVMPKSRGGISSWTNCVLACVECNKFKANRTPDEAKMTLRKVPKKPSWKALAEIPSVARRESWEQFLSRAYWEVELEA
jgi:5-methylcytosine-specific restriction endonuclease McrA